MSAIKKKKGVESKGDDEEEKVEVENEKKDRGIEDYRECEKNVKHVNPIIQNMFTLSEPWLIQLSGYSEWIKRGHSNDLAFYIYKMQNAIVRSVFELPHPR